MKAKIKEALRPKVRTSHAQEELLEQERMSSPKFTDYDEFRKVVVKISSYEREMFKFIKSAEQLLRGFKIPYSYYQTDFLFTDASGDDLVLWFDIYDDTEDRIFVGPPGRDLYYESFSNELDAVNYVHRELGLPGQ